jgi:adenosylmethionine-8-amino-7-oxononanoate aminotransferase
MRKRTMERGSNSLMVPPFIITEEQIDGMDGILYETIKEREL